MIIGISGRIGSGKDTLAKAIQYMDWYSEGDASNLISFEDWYEKILAIEASPNGGVKHNWQVRKYADKLKDICCMFLGVPRTKFESREFKESILGPEWNNMTVREFIQRLGTEGVRNNLHTNAWVNALYADYRKMSDHEHKGGGMATNGPAYYPNWIITDVRFPNEAQAVKDRGGLMIRVERPNNPHPVSTHQSETAMDDWEYDMVVTNTSFASLTIAADEILNKVN